MYLWVWEPLPWNPKDIITTGSTKKTEYVFNYPVMNDTGFPASESGRKVYRGSFIAITEKDILKAMDTLVEPSKDEALALDARKRLT
ncbi:uncharacterized protein A4U43_C10F12580 [Asparagus officinalis]|uniref:Uncharacterized protein n=1 Tax=Asparagus officinalis TaxID=4686 RepID=A0A5P1E2L9_ASPOF|nr:uncharacterized protein A4U43_C10F12580 [Asparagus officinalis]